MHLFNTYFNTLVFLVKRIFEYEKKSKCIYKNFPLFIQSINHTFSRKMVARRRLFNTSWCILRFSKKPRSEFYSTFKLRRFRFDSLQLLFLIFCQRIRVVHIKQFSRFSLKFYYATIRSRNRYAKDKRSVHALMYVRCIDKKLVKDW